MTEEQIINEYSDVMMVDIACDELEKLLKYRCSCNPQIRQNDIPFWVKDYRMVMEQ